MQKPKKPVLPTRKTRPGGFFGLSVHRAGLDQPWARLGLIKFELVNFVSIA